VSIVAVPMNVLRCEVKWNFVSMCIGPSVVIILNCFKLSKTRRDCLIVFVNKKFLFITPQEQVGPVIPLVLGTSFLLVKEYI
jgi:hypothetical protein